MADKKISQFPTFDGAAGSEVFFVVGSGEADNPNASNYRYPFNNLTTDITKAGSAWITGTDLIYTLTGAVGLGTSAPIYQLDVANTGRFRSDLIVSGDLFVSGTTHIQKIIDVSITGTISGVTGEFADGIFADSLTISGTPVSTGGSIEVPGGGGSIIGGDVSNINFGGTEASDTRAVNFQVGGVDKLVIGSDGNISISEDLTVSGNVSGAIISGRSGVFSHSLTVSGQPVLTGTSSSLGKWTDGLSAGDIYYNGGDVSIGSNAAYGALTAQSDGGHVGFNAGTSLSPERGNIFYTTDGTSWGLNIGKYDIGTTAFTPQMTLKTNGYVGIGTTLPLTTLHVSGAAIIQDNRVNNFQPVTVANYDSTAASTQTTSLGFGLARDSSSRKSNAGVITVGKEQQWTVDDTHLDSYMSFSILDGMVSRERVRIGSNGDVGIGTGAPAGALHIVNPSANTLTLTREINVLGIVDGAVAKIEGGALSAASPSMGAALGFSLVDVDGAGVGSNTKGHLYFETKDPGGSLTEKMRIDASGNVGIGTAQPGGPLEILKGVAGHVDQLFLTNNNGQDDDSAGLVFTQASATHNYAGIRGIFTDVTAATEDAELAFYTSEAGTYAEKVRIDNNGNVGIGTSTPTNHLQVGNFVGASSYGLAVSGTDFGAIIRVQTATPTRGALIVENVLNWPTIDNLFRVNANGNVGIGVEVPAAPLDVVSTVGGVIMPRMTTTEMNAIATPSNGEMIYNTSSGKFAGYAGGSWTALH